MHANGKGDAKAGQYGAGGGKERFARRHNKLCAGGTVCRRTQRGTFAGIHNGPFYHGHKGDMRGGGRAYSGPPCKKRLWLYGALAGTLYAVLAFIVFSAVAGTLYVSIALLSDIAIGAVSGLISVMVLQMLK